MIKVYSILFPFHRREYSSERKSRPLPPPDPYSSSSSSGREIPFGASLRDYPDDERSYPEDSRGYTKSFPRDRSYQEQRSYSEEKRGYAKPFPSGPERDRRPERGYKPPSPPPPDIVPSTDVIHHQSSVPPPTRPRNYKLLMDPFLIKGKHNNCQPS